MANSFSNKRPRVVVVGAGHGGLECVKALRKAPVDVLLIDRNNFHTFQPLLYQVATAGLDVNDITQSVRHIVRDQPNVDVRLGRVVGADLEAKTLHLDDGTEVGYDELVLAPGASTAYFGVEGAFEHGFPLKSVTDAVDLRSHVLDRFEAASADPSLVGAGALTVVVVGGGPTGVETAGALRELFRVLARDFPDLAVERARVVLVDGSEAPLGGYTDDLRAYTQRALESRGVEVHLGSNVEAVNAEGVRLADGTEISAQTTVWAAGIRAVPLADALELEQTDGHRVVVDPSLRVPGTEAVYVVGDAAGARDADGHLHPQVAQVAIQQGKHVARLVAERAQGGAGDAPFQYRDLGQMATIGRNAAVLQLPSGFSLRGWIAWVGWLLVHVLSLVGFRNRVSVLFSWIYNYFTYDRGPRLILTAEADAAPSARTSSPAASEPEDIPNAPAVADNALALADSER
ncbi:MAG: NAD(P)/FAD-dependent oxidoreductase [Bacteroidota bacterium]